jgi:arthrofactin-type cyclic lipopeptide synthetase C
VPRDGTLSFAQQRLWFLAQMDGGNSAYNIPLGLRLRGRLDVEACSALTQIVARHETLRSRFVSVDDQAQVTIAPVDSGLLLQVEDLRQDPQAEATVQALLAQEAATAVRSAARSADSRTPGASGRRSPCAVADRASHHRRWLVDGRADP